VWLLRSLAIALAAAVVAGCSDAKSYSAEEIAKALRAQGFEVGVTEPDAKLTAAIPGAAAQGSLPEGLSQTLVQFRDIHRHGSPDSVSDLELEAFVFERSGKASCDQPNVVGTCLRKRNVVIVVRKDRARAAREALEDL
jgi:hypothetical protein